MQRRRFLKNTVALTSCSLLGGLLPRAYGKIKNKNELALNAFWAACRKQEFAEVGITYFARDIQVKTFKGQQLWRGQDGQGFLVNANGYFARFPLSIPAHSFYQHPTQRNWVWAIPSFDKKSVICDLRSGKTIAEIQLPDLSFYGHGQILEEGKDISLYTTMYAGDEIHKGCLVKVDLKTKKVIQQLKLEGESFHEIAFQPQRDSFFVAGKNARCANFYEIRRSDFSLLNSLPCPNRFEFRHLDTLKSGRVLLIGHGDAPETFPFNISPIALADLDSKKITPLAVDAKYAPQFGGEALNALLSDDQKTALISNPYKGVVFEVNLETMSLIKVHEGFLTKSFQKIESKYISMGVVKGLIQSSFYVSDDFNHINTGEILADSRPSAFGSHLHKIKI